MSDLTTKLKAALCTNGLGDWPGLNEDLAKKLIACVDQLEEFKHGCGSDYCDHPACGCTSALAELEKELGKGT